MAEFNFDYEQLAKKILEQMQGSIAIVTLQRFTAEYIAFVERSRAPKTLALIKSANKRLLKFLPGGRI